MTRSYVSPLDISGLSLPEGRRLPLRKGHDSALASNARLDLPEEESQPSLASTESRSRIECLEPVAEKRDLRPGFRSLVDACRVISAAIRRVGSAPTKLLRRELHTRWYLRQAALIHVVTGIVKRSFTADAALREERRRATKRSATRRVSRDARLASPPHRPPAARSINRHRCSSERIARALRGTGVPRGHARRGGRRPERPKSERSRCRNQDQAATPRIDKPSSPSSSSPPHPPSLSLSIYIHIHIYTG